MPDYFPTKLALGTQFCNRTDEKATLHDNIKLCRHTVLVAPRHYGKSSLVFKVVSEAGLPLASIDLFLANDDAAVTKRMLAGVAQAISAIMPIEQKVLVKLQQVFGNFRVSLTASGFSLDASMDAASFDPIDQVFSALKGLDKLAKQQQQKVIVFIDEFQDIREAGNSKSLQGAIRHVAQETENIVFIFSGSNRHLLTELFDDSTMPLYMLYDMLYLDRIASKDYLPHLQKLAKKTWNKPLPDIVFNKIMALTELHSYYVNLLCHELWKLKQLPSLDDVFASWQRCYDVQEDRLVAELEKLTVKQRIVLQALATDATTEPMGQQFVAVTKSSASTINQTLKALIQKDMAHRVKREDSAVPQLAEGQYRVLDPLLAFALRKYA